MKYDSIMMDASSIINFIRYYHEYYSHYSKEDKKAVNKVIFDGLIDFLVDKVKIGEIIVLDKVYEELRSKDLLSFKKKIKDYQISSLEIIEDVQDLIEKYYIKENEIYLNNEQDKIELELENYEQKYADLFLIAYTNKLKVEGKKVLLITEEGLGKDGKLIEKLPVICKKENEDIICRRIPFVLFENYLTELEFNLNITKNEKKLKL